jgi:ArsR family transcriptional regulator, arsenate/arsenite/antimonite-responsive transcriptional repressor
MPKGSCFNGECGSSVFSNIRTEHLAKASSQARNPFASSNSARLSSVIRLNPIFISTILEIWKWMIYCSGMDSNLVVRALSALAHESRLAIFRLLVVAGPDGMAAGEIAQQLGLSPSSLSFHLKDLSHADLVKPRQEGRFIIYTANFDAMSGLIAFLTENCCAGATCAASNIVSCCGDKP